MSKPHQPSDRPRSMLIAILWAGAVFWIAWAVYQHHLRGAGDLVGYASVAIWLAGVRLSWHTLNLHEVNRRGRRTMKAANTVQKTHGRARFAATKDTKKAGMHRPGGHLLGRLSGRDVYYHKEGSIWCYGQPGSGKMTCGLGPNLVQAHVDAKGRAVSLFVFDMKGELFSVFRRRLEELGYDVRAVCPMADKMSRELGIEIADTGYNPLLSLLDAGLELKAEAEKLAGLLLPLKPGSEGSHAYFTHYGREILVFGMMQLSLRNDQSKLNLCELRSILMASDEDFDEMLACAAASPVFGGALAECANKIANTKVNAPREYSAALNTALQPLALYDAAGPLGKSVSRTDGFDPATIKDKPMAVFMIVPSEYTEAHNPWVNLTLSTSIERMAKDRTNRRVRLYIDEFSNCGYIPNLIKAIGLYRSQGQQYIMYAQTPSQIRTLYGESGYRDLVGLCDVIQVLGARDPEVCNQLSQLAGQDTVKDYSQSVRPYASGDQMGFSSSASNTARPLIRPEEIRTMSPDEQLVFIGGMPPMVMKKISYLKRPSMRRHADANPYYERSKRS